MRVSIQEVPQPHKGKLAEPSPPAWCKLTLRKKWLCMALSCSRIEFADTMAQAHICQDRHVPASVATYIVGAPAQLCCGSLTRGPGIVNTKSKPEPFSE